MNLPDLIGTLLGFVLTIAIFSYLLGDNRLFRFALHLFIGAASGYVAAVLIYNVLFPRLFFPMLFGSWGERLYLLLPLLLVILLLFKLSPRTSWLGTASMAILAGVGAAVAVGGAVLGTLFSQIGATVSGFNLGNGLIVLLGTMATLIYFQFGVRQNGTEESTLQQVLNGVGVVGQVFVAIAFGVLFAGIYIAALTAFLERFDSFWVFLNTFLPF
ncbi:MAG: hypothetical protein ACK2UW_12770 [Anaerolineales bacterium]|jgi:hypothetical protein